MARTSTVFARVEPEIKEQDEIAKGVADIENGRVYSAEEVFDEMHRLHGV